MKEGSLQVSGVYTSLFLDTDELKMALRARNAPGAFEKRAPDVFHSLNPRMPCGTYGQTLRCKHSNLIPRTLFNSFNKMLTTKNGRAVEVQKHLSSLFALLT